MRSILRRSILSKSSDDRLDRLGLKLALANLVVVVAFGFASHLASQTPTHPRSDVSHPCGDTLHFKAITPDDQPKACES